MATTNPSDKFAFLLSNSTDDGYVKDLETVFDTLHTYYNYPKDQIWVVFGDSGTSKTYFTDAQNALITDYSTAIDNFIPAAQVPADKRTGLH